MGYAKNTELEREFVEPKNEAEREEMIQNDMYCFDCQNTGETCIPAHQRGGHIVDEVVEPCSHPHN